MPCVEVDIALSNLYLKLCTPCPLSLLLVQAAQQVTVQISDLSTFSRVVMGGFQILKFNWLFRTKPFKCVIFSFVMGGLTNISLGALIVFHLVFGLGNLLKVTQRDLERLFFI